MLAMAGLFQGFYSGRKQWTNHTLIQDKPSLSLKSHVYQAANPLGDCFVAGLGGDLRSVAVQSREPNWNGDGSGCYFAYLFGHDRQFVHIRSSARFTESTL